MERDPFRLAWKAAPARHLMAVLLLLAAATLLFALLDIVRLAVDRVLLGGAAEPLLRLPLLGDDPPAILAALVALPLLLGLAVAGAESLASGIATSALRRVRRAVVDAVLDAPPAAWDEAASAGLLSGEALSREGGVLGAALVAPLQAAGTIGVALLYAALLDLQLAMALAATLAIFALCCGMRLDRRVRAALARRNEGAVIEHAFGDLLRRLPALRAHGTSDYERGRLEEDGAREHRVVEREERRLAVAEAAATAALLLVPLAVIAAGTGIERPEPLTPGAILGAAVAAGFAALSVRELVQWARLIEQAGSHLADLARGLAPLQRRGRQEASAALPRSGTLVAEGVSAYDPASGGRISFVDLRIAFPAHVALVGDGDQGPRVLAALIGGQLDASTGRLSYGGADLSRADPRERARRIAFAGGETVLIPGTLRQNLLYGCPPGEPDLDARLREAVAAAGLDGMIHARGLAGRLDPAREAKLAAAVVESRRAVRTALARDGLDRFVDPFDAGRYNHHATIGENLIFGEPIGDTFDDAHLASHPFVQAVLEAEELTKPLAAVGLSIATSMIEIFAEIPDGHPLFERFAFFSAADRPFFEDLVARRNERRRGPGSVRDRERLIGLALRYSESRHRLGLVDDRLQARLVAARASFARMLPASLAPAIEFYDETRLCTAASVQDNLLFGRLASDQAGAEAAVHAVMRRVLTERGLDDGVFRIGLDSPVDPRGGDLTTAEAAAIDLVRCLVRRPDLLVVERALDGLPAAAADGLVSRLRRALVGRGLVLVTSRLSDAMDAPAFDAVIRFERGIPRMEDRRVRPEPVPA